MLSLLTKVLLLFTCTHFDIVVYCHRWVYSTKYYSVPLFVSLLLTTIRAHWTLWVQFHDQSSEAVTCKHLAYARTTTWILSSCCLQKKSPLLNTCFSCHVRSRAWQGYKGTWLCIQESCRVFRGFSEQREMLRSNPMEWEVLHSSPSTSRECLGADSEYNSVFGNRQRV